MTFPIISLLVSSLLAVSCRSSQSVEVMPSSQYEIPLQPPYYGEEVYGEEAQLPWVGDHFSNLDSGTDSNMGENFEQLEDNNQDDDWDEIYSLTEGRQDDLHDPFEKVYVEPFEILSTPYGIFHRTSTGEYEPVRAILRDCNGTYVIKIVQQCPVCGRQYMTKHPPEGYDCPLWDIEVLPNIWCAP